MLTIEIEKGELYNLKKPKKAAKKRVKRKKAKNGKR